MESFDSGYSSDSAWPSSLRRTSSTSSWGTDVDTISQPRTPTLSRRSSFAFHDYGEDRDEEARTDFGSIAPKLLCLKPGSNPSPMSENTPLRELKPFETPRGQRIIYPSSPSTPMSLGSSPPGSYYANTFSSPISSQFSSPFSQHDFGVHSPYHIERKPMIDFAAHGHGFIPAVEIKAENAASMALQSALPANVDLPVADIHMSDVENIHSGRSLATNRRYRDNRRAHGHNTKSPVRTRKASREARADPTDTFFPPAIVSSKDKKHPCTFRSCKMRFRRQEHLKRHHMTHTGEKNFPCIIPWCNHRASRRDNLLNHMERHVLKNDKARNAYAPEFAEAIRAYREQSRL